MRLAALALGVVLAAASGCRFDGDGAGENFRCDEGHGCPGGQVCQGGRCVLPGAEEDAGGSDSGTDDGLVAWYRMETAVSGELVDETGSHQGMCAEGQCPAEVVGRIGGALQFDGVDDHIRVPHHAAFNPAQGAVTAWVFYDGGFEFAGVVGKGYGPFSGDAWLIFVNPEPGVRIGFETAGGEVLYADVGLLASHRWEHVAVTWNETTKRIYIDGDAVAEAAVEMDFDGRDVLIGADEDLPAVVIPFAGAIDEIRVYGRELLPEEIATLAEQS